MTAPAERHLDVRQAEGLLVGACIAHRYALDATWEALHAYYGDARPDAGYFSDPDHELILRALVVLYDQGRYDELENDVRIADLLGRVTDHDAASWQDYLEGLYSPFTVDHDYVDALLAAVMTNRQLLDAAHKAYDELLHHNSLALDEGLEDAVWLRLREALVRRQNERHARVTARADSTPGTPPPPVDWEAIHKRATK